MKNIFRPSRGVRIWARTQSREEIELQMIVRINETGKKQKTAQIDLRLRVRQARRERYKAVVYRKPAANGRRGARRHARACDQHGLSQTPVNSAGTAAAAAKR